ncbi:uncharacterized protein LOC143180001 [Calliopsis andreniformis]|uniref:uncharacterized protein LOC143180001 n=1 Tax=Calliopsis andreniformis TaxID=337506 RepID=UPI003FCC372B
MVSVTARRTSTPLDSNARGCAPPPLLGPLRASRSLTARGNADECPRDLEPRPFSPPLQKPRAEFTSRNPRFQEDRHSRIAAFQELSTNRFFSLSDLQLRSYDARVRSLI